MSPTDLEAMMQRNPHLRRIDDAARPAAAAPAKRQVQQHRRGVMNKTEAAFAAELDLWKKAEEIVEYWFERVTFLLADDLRYTPDFMVLDHAGRFKFYEVKGFMRDDARVKARTFVQLFPFPLIVVRRKAPGWEYEQMRRIA